MKPLVWVIRSNGGYTLYLVILVLTIAGALFTISLTEAGMVRAHAARRLQKVQARMLAQSGVERASWFFNGGDGRDLYWETDRFEEKLDDYGLITIACKRFGGYSRIVSEGTRLEQVYTIEGLAGRNLPENLEPVLTITGAIGGVVLAKGSSISGTVVLDHGIVKKDNNRRPYPGAGSWTLLDKSPALPFDSEPLDQAFDVLHKIFAGAKADTSAIDGKRFTNASFPGFNAHTILTVSGDCSFGDVRLVNGTVAVTGALTIAPGCFADGVRFIAERIEVAGGSTAQCLFYAEKKINVNAGTHNSQFFSPDTLTVDAASENGPLSLWCVRRKAGRDSSYAQLLQFDKKGVYRGTAICYTDTTQNISPAYDPPAIVLGRGSVFEGSIICDGDIDMHSVSVRGHIWAKAIVAVEDDLSHRNYIFSSRIERPRSETPFPLLGEPPARVSMLDGR